jgi:hypothetical protein
VTGGEHYLKVSPLIHLDPVTVVNRYIGRVDRRHPGWPFTDIDEGRAI